MSEVLLPALLAGAAATVWWGLPRPASLRVDDVLPRVEPAVCARRIPTPDHVVGPLRGRVGRRRREEAERERAVEACAVLAAELRAGRAPAAALQAAAEVATGPVAVCLRAAAGTAALGGDVGSALAAVPGDAERSAVPELLAGLGACWTVCAATGSGLAAAVERLGESQRAAADQRRAVEVELAGPRATARLLALLPVLGLLLAVGLGAQPLGFLLGTTPGRLCLAAGVGLEVLGLRWTGRLARRAAEGS